MAVQKSRKSPSKSGMKRAHSALTQPALATDRTSGETHRRHHITKLGYLKGKKALRTEKATTQTSGE